MHVTTAHERRGISSCTHFASPLNVIHLVLAAHNVLANGLPVTIENKVIWGFFKFRHENRII